jgi:hypothetical protein
LGPSALTTKLSPIGWIEPRDVPCTPAWIGARLLIFTVWKAAHRYIRPQLNAAIAGTDAAKTRTPPVAATPPKAALAWAANDGANR